jgi:hypothetical protein
MPSLDLPLPRSGQDFILEKGLGEEATRDQFQAA